MIKYYKDEENYLWKSEDDCWEILDPMLGWDEWSVAKDAFEFTEITEEEAIAFANDKGLTIDG